MCASWKRVKGETVECINCLTVFTATEDNQLFCQPCIDADKSSPDIDIDFKF